MRALRCGNDPSFRRRSPGRIYCGRPLLQPAGARLGDDFADEIESGVRTILAAPFIWRAIEDDVRRLLVSRFPYGIYYTIEGDIVVIWAVKHLHRDPDYWQQRRS